MLQLYIIKPKIIPKLIQQVVITNERERKINGIIKYIQSKQNPKTREEKGKQNPGNK